MTEQSTINPADQPRLERPDTCSISDIEGKVIHITGYSHTRGKPTQFTQAADIGPDGKTDYRVISTSEVFNLEYKSEGVKPINHFYVKKAQGDQIEAIQGYAEALASGKRIGPWKPLKRKSEKNPAQSYWCFSNEKDADFN